jgi:hypothetical protein
MPWILNVSNISHIYVCDVTDTEVKLIVRLKLWL